MCCFSTTPAVADDGPYCGIYAVYGAASALGVSVSFEDILKPEFVSGKRGSTVDDLVKAVRHFGLNAQPLAGLGIASLRESTAQLVLHVSSFGQLDFYNHWLLFLGMESGKARTVDGNGTIFLMDPAELLARWDGVGIAISRQPSSATFGSIETAAFALWGLLVVLTLGGASVIANRFSRTSRQAHASWMTTIMLPTAVLIGIREVHSELSLWQNPDCVRFIMAAEGHREFPNVSTAELSSLIKRDRDLLIFDTRYDGDMAYGFVPGARPLPVDLNQQQMASQLKGVDRSRPVIVYCQSQGCHFSDRMAIVLSGFGFADIRIYRDGWVGWREVYGIETTNAVNAKE